MSRIVPSSSGVFSPAEVGIEAGSLDAGFGFTGVYTANTGAVRASSGSPLIGGELGVYSPQFVNLAASFPLLLAIASPRLSKWDRRGPVKKKRICIFNTDVLLGFGGVLEGFEDLYLQ